MSYSLFPILLDFEDVEEIIGSKRREFSEQIRKGNLGLYGRGEESLLHVSALEALVFGTPNAGGLSSCYGVVLLDIFEHVGTTLPCDSWESIRWKTIEESGLASLQAKYSIAKLVSMPNIEGCCVWLILADDLNNFRDSVNLQRGNADWLEGANRQLSGWIS